MRIGQCITELTHRQKNNHTQNLKPPFYLTSISLDSGRKPTLAVQMNSIFVTGLKLNFIVQYLFIYIKEKTTLWIFRSICHAENMNSSLSSNRELHKLSIIKLIKIWLGLTSCHGNIRVSHTCCFFFPLLLLTLTPCS